MLNLRTEQEGSLDEKPKVEALGVEYFNIPIGREGFSPEIVSKFRDILAETANRPILIHCASSNRVGAMWYIHQVLENGESESSALEEAKKAGLRSETLEGRAKDYVAQNKPDFKNTLFGSSSVYSNCSRVTILQRRSDVSKLKTKVSRWRVHVDTDVLVYALSVSGPALCANILETIRSLKLVSRAEEDHR